MAVLPGDDGPYVFESELPREADGKGVLDYLAGRFAYQDRDTWERRIRNGDVLLDGRKLTDPQDALAGGGRLAYVHGTYVEPEVPTSWRVLFIASDWMAVSKPAGMPVHSTPRIFRQALVWQVRRLFGEGWSPVHRLDRDTSGLVLFARGERMPRVLSGAFSNRSIEKTYLALVHGEPREDFVVDAPLGKLGDPRIPLRVGVRQDGKDACTRIRILGADADRRGTWVEALPLQGRLHQIRAHLESAGHPIVGDILYDGRGGEAFLARAAGADSDEIARIAGSERMWLHARKLRFLEGVRGMPRSLECPLPDDGVDGMCSKCQNGS